MISAPVTLFPEILEAGYEVVQPALVNLRVLARDQGLTGLCLHNSLILCRTSGDRAPSGPASAIWLLVAERVLVLGCLQLREQASLLAVVALHPL